MLLQLWLCVKPPLGKEEEEEEERGGECLLSLGRTAVHSREPLKNSPSKLLATAEDNTVEGRKAGQLRIHSLLLHFFLNLLNAKPLDPPHFPAVQAGEGGGGL